MVLCIALPQYLPWGGGGVMTYVVYFALMRPVTDGELAAGSAHLRCFGHTYWLLARAE